MRNRTITLRLHPDDLAVIVGAILQSADVATLVGRYGHTDIGSGDHQRWMVAGVRAWADRVEAALQSPAGSKA